jgi:predicted aspartyl protease
MKSFPFKRQESDDLILVNLVIDGYYRFKVAIDTAASHTVLDSNALFMMGYELRHSVGVESVETANGVIETAIFKLKSVECVGIKRPDFEIQVYDFLAHGILSDYHGLVGLDFFEGKIFCIDMIKNCIYTR